MTGPRLPLHLWRRLDWRYLLPVHRVGDVVLAGPADDLLEAALPLLGTSLRRIERGEDWPSVREAADVVVLVQPDDDDLRGAVAALRPGGFRRPPRGSLRGRKSPRSRSGSARRRARR